MNKETLIKELLKSGSSVDELVAQLKEEASKAEKAKAAAKKKEEALNKKRSAVISALLNYYEELGIAPTEDKEIEHFVDHVYDILEATEKSVKILTEFAENAESPKTDNDVIKTFIKTIM